MMVMPVIMVVVIMAVFMRVFMVVAVIMQRRPWQPVLLAEGFIAA